MEEFIMSARNGDKARFHRIRKKNIARRKRTEELLKALSAKPANPSRSGSQSVPA